MRVLIFSLAYFPLVGGAEVAIKEITDRIPDIEFDMITLRFDKAHPEFERVGNVNVHRIGSGSSYLGKILFVPQAALYARKLQKERKFDLLWAIMTNMAFPISFMRILGDRTPFVITLQDGDPFEYVFGRLRIRIFKPLLTYSFKQAYKIQAISNFLADWANEKGYKGKVEVIPNGVDIKKFEGISTKTSSDGTVLIHTGRLVVKNGIGDVIDSLKFLPENVKLVLIGTGPLVPELKKQAEALKVSHRVEFLGFMDLSEIPKHLHNADIFIRPSLSEGMGNSFIEAMAASIPVIATDVGGIPDFLFDPDKDHDMPPTGLFVPVHNPRLIAFQVQRLMNDRVLRDKITINAKRMVLEKYDWDLIAREIKSKVFPV